MNKQGLKLVSKTQIYLDCRKLIDLVFDVTPYFPRAYKYSVGSQLHQLCIELIAEVSAAYINRDRDTRVRHLTEFQAKFEVVKTLLYIAGERKWILGKSKHANTLELLDAIGRQSTAWKNSLVNTAT